MSDDSKCMGGINRCQKPVYKDDWCKYHYKEIKYSGIIQKTKKEWEQEDLEGFSKWSGYSIDEIFELN